jgi:ribonuclease P protein component
LLDQVHRMRSSEDYRATVRRGAKGARPTLVAHVVLPATRDAGRSGDPTDGPHDSPKSDRVTSVGFVVNKGVGTAVVRNRVKRRLRHLMRARLSDVPAGSRIVIRALPAAHEASSSTLADDLDEALRRAGAR